MPKASSAHSTGGFDLRDQGSDGYTPSTTGNPQHEGRAQFAIDLEFAVLSLSKQSFLPPDGRPCRQVALRSYPRVTLHIRVSLSLIAPR